jgi:hypothetical protein
MGAVPLVLGTCAEIPKENILKKISVVKTDSINNVLNFWLTIIFSFFDLELG